MATINPEILKSQGIRFVRIIWCDTGNVIRGKAIHIDTLAERLDIGVGLSTAQQAIPVMADAVAPDSGLGPVGEVWLRPDWSTLKPLPYAPGQARVFGDMSAKWRVTLALVQPAVFAANGLDQCGSCRALEIKPAFEPEFYLLRMDWRNNYSPFIRRSDGCLRPPWPWIPTGRVVGWRGSPPPHRPGLNHRTGTIPNLATGQQEFPCAIPMLWALPTSTSFNRETVKAVARHHGLIASFVPKIFVTRLPVVAVICT